MSRKMALVLSTALTVFVLIVGVALAARLGAASTLQSGGVLTDPVTAVAPAVQAASDATTSDDRALQPAEPGPATRPARSSEREREHGVAAYGLREGRSADHHGRGGREDDDD